MSYTVTWWEGSHRTERHVADQVQAHTWAEHLRARSAAHLSSSLVPIRVLERAVWDRMQQLVLETNHERFCVHRCVRRLCVPCVTKMLETEGARDVLPHHQRQSRDS